MQPTFFINHGGGPCFFLEPGPMRAAWKELEDYLAGFAANLAERPRAILAISGHWEERLATVNAGPAPPLLYDYSGFPPHTYALTWPAPGDPGLAFRVRELLAQAGIPNGSEEKRGWDHGIFVPLKVMFPAADIPVVQLSLQQGLDPAAHLALGHALSPLRKDGVLILGSGQSYHNLRGFFDGRPDDPAADAFDEWLQTTITVPEGREQALVSWEQAPGARSAQPREDHFIPLIVAAGAAIGEPATIHFHGHVLGKPITGFRFG
jgi:aromatic ring-opening dioxygenase catalytic subunit (LigB family)